MANPNPSPATRFKEGSCPNPGGKTKEQKAKEVEAAQMASDLRHAMLSSMMEKLSDGSDILDYVDANTLKLFKDSEDRAHGTPKATTELGGPNGGAIPISKVEYAIYDPVKDAD